MKFSTTFLSRILLIAVLTAMACTAFGQRKSATQERALVTGEYTLTQSDVDRLTDVYEWMLNVKFTPAERRKYQALVVKEAQSNKVTAKALTDMLQSWAKIEKLDPERREQMRAKLTPAIVSDLEKDDNELNALLLAVYRNAQAKNGDDDSTAGVSADDEPQTAGAPVKVADLAGIWSTSSVSGERYRSLVTGELSDPSGSIIEYQISPNGTIKHVGYLSSTVYSCTTKLFLSRTGRISISGSNITFNFAPGKRMYQTCSASASRNDTLPAERKTYPFRIERDQYGIQLCTVEENGKDFCIRKKGD